MSKNDVAIIGGCGHVGLPFGIVLANIGFDVKAIDLDLLKVEKVNQGIMPFIEFDSENLLKSVIQNKKFFATTDTKYITNADSVVVIVGTPIDEHLNPKPMEILRILEDLRPQFVSGQLIILRSTVYPGVTRIVEKWFKEIDETFDIVFCPERIAQGFAMTELHELPQIIGSRDSRSAARAEDFFSKLGCKIIHSSPEEAELSKLYTNVWRYIKFAAANDFFKLANDFGVNYEKIRYLVTEDYPRAADLPRQGFTAGPCLYKDSMQLLSFSNNKFSMAYSAMLTNEGMPQYLVELIEKDFDLQNLTIGIMGMSFKPNIDDSRSSLSYKLKNILEFKAKKVIYTDPYVSDLNIKSLAEVITNSDIIIIGVPHEVYRHLEVTKPLYDLWDVTRSQNLILKFNNEA